MIPISKVAMSPTANRRVDAVLHSGRLEHGPLVDEFEQAVADRIGNRRVVAVNSGTSGLHLALSLAARPGDEQRRPGDEQRRPGDGNRRPGVAPGEVLTTPLTFEGSNWPILANGLRIRWVDIDPATLNIDLDDLAAKISPATRAILVVHWTGYPVDLDGLRRVVDRAEAEFGFRPVVIEDAAQAWGATYHGRPLGNHGNVCVYSVGAIKLLTCGSGGLVVLPDDAGHERVVRRRWFGIDRSADRAHADYDVADWGYRFTMNELCAAIGLENLGMTGDLLRRTRANAAHFDRELAGVPGLEHTERAGDREPSFWVYPLKVHDRPGFMRKLAGAGVMSSMVARRNDAHSCVAAAASTLPGLDKVHDQVVNIPVGWWLSEQDRAHIVDTIRSGW